MSFNDFGPITNTGTGTALAEPGEPGSSITNGTPLQMGPYRGDQTVSPWHVSYHHYMTG